MVHLLALVLQGWVGLVLQALLEGARQALQHLQEASEALLEACSAHLRAPAGLEQLQDWDLLVSASQALLASAHLLIAPLVALGACLAVVQHLSPLLPLGQVRPAQDCSHLASWDMVIFLLLPLMLVLEQACLDFCQAEQLE